MVHIDGCIGVGKTSLIKYIKGNHIVHTTHNEPLGFWTGGENNLLDEIHRAYGQGTPRHICALQHLIALPFHHRDMFKFKTNPATFNARTDWVSVSDRHMLAPLLVFPLHHLMEDKITFTEFSSLVFSYNVYTHDTVVFLDCSPEELLRRVRTRDRPEEANIPISYIESLRGAYNMVYNTWKCVKRIPFSSALFHNTQTPDLSPNIFRILSDKRPVTCSDDTFRCLIYKIYMVLYHLTLFKIDVEQFRSPKEIYEHMFNYLSKCSEVVAYTVNWQFASRCDLSC